MIVCHTRPDMHASIGPAIFNEVRIRQPLLSPSLLALLSAGSPFPWSGRGINFSVPFSYSTPG